MEGNEPKAPTLRDQAQQTVSLVRERERERERGGGEASKQQRHSHQHSSHQSLKLRKH